MGIVFRQSVKSTIVNLTGSALGVFVMWLGATYVVSKQELGFVNTLTQYGVSLASFLALGLPSTLALYFHKYSDSPRKKAVLLGICLVVPLLTMALFSAGYGVFQQRVVSLYEPGDRALANEFYWWLPIYTTLFLYLMLLEQYLAANMKVAVSQFAKEVVVRLVNILLLILFAFRMISLAGLVAGMVLMYLVPVVYSAYASWKIGGLHISLKVNALTRDDKWEITHYSWYHCLFVVALTGMEKMDFLLLSFYDKTGLAAAAIYNIPLMLVSFMALPLRAMSPAAATVMAKAYAEERVADARNFFARASLNILIATAAVAMLLCSNLQNIMALLPPGYEQVPLIFLILMAGKLLDISTGMNDQVLSITNHYKFNFYLSVVLMLLLWALLWLLVPEYGVFGAAWAITITRVLFNIAKFLFVWLKLSMQPYSRRTLLVVIASLPALVVGYYMPKLFGGLSNVYVSTLIDACARSVIVILLYALMLLWLRPSQDIEDYLAQVRKNKRLF